MTYRPRPRRTVVLDATLTLRLRGDWREALDDLADERDLSTTDLARAIVHDYLVAAGRLPATVAPRGSVLRGASA